jgi:hypothetical protein
VIYLSRTPLTILVSGYFLHPWYVINKQSCSVQQQFL